MNVVDNKGTSIATSGVELKGVSKSFGAVDVIHDIDLSITAGEFVVFVGPSGCGKSTLLRLIAGLEETSRGEILIGGRDVTDADPSDRGIAMVFQSYALYPHMTVAQNMGFGLRMAHRPNEEVTAMVRHAAEILHLTPLLDRRPGQLSGGQRQRVAIGRAIVRNPEVFLFDEPLSNLDAELRVGMRIEIDRLHKQLGNTMIYVTHDQTEAMTLADKIVVLRAGRIEQIGSPFELYSDPDNLFVAGFIGSPKMNFVPARHEAGALVVAGHRLTFAAPAGLPTNCQLQLGIRPENLKLTRDGERGLAVTVGFTEFLGGTTYLYGHIEPGMPLIVQGEPGPAPLVGQTVFVTFDPTNARFFDADGMRIRNVEGRPEAVSGD
ncbi:ABC transporter, nucleotide binding/ATPase protein (sugar) ugpC-like [Agrobacterium fabacearum CFBP 5771]|uniref:ABC transporter ATP-binding protein n=1 Tax=Agrobacterium tumefaciens TaxID=358 RepID=A0A4D7YL78_AGRTU|nr:ABC transporter ATP-binding protein [Agrobacterium tumefaciens]QCL98061.1 ABC transporter ATP-binding protein [Agrobacterium tumefaciens]CVI24570.1 ABC transporter, nucleotide binding/ATPase protein (sugar) ugpC-like [Agrobacterium fabacearum CFBP 5771]